MRENPHTSTHAGTHAVILLGEGPKSRKMIGHEILKLGERKHAIAISVIFHVVLLAFCEGILNYLAIVGAMVQIVPW